MRVNQSQGSNSRSNPSENSKFFPNYPSLPTHRQRQQSFTNPHRKTQIILSIILVALTTLWVQISVQRYGPFIRSAQCYFNQIVLQHKSQDIYEGTDVIYWRNGQTYNFQKMQRVFQNLSKTVQNLGTNSLFQLSTNRIYVDEEEHDVQILTIYRYNIPESYHRFDTFNSSIKNMGQLFQQTLLNRSFYEHLWKIELSVAVPLEYRNETVLMQLDFTAQIFSSFFMQYNLDVNIVDEDLNQVKSINPNSTNNLQTRKLNNPHDLQLNISYLNWVVLVIYMGVFLLQYRYIVQKNQYLNQKVKKKLSEEIKIQQLLQKIDPQEKVPLPQPHSSIYSQFMEKEHKTLKKIQQAQQKYKLPLSQKLEKIGYYYIVELAISFFAFFSYYNDSNGFICFFSWVKIIVYLAETKNRLMFGFLFQETIPTYLRIYFNIILWITAFVLFNMLVFTTTKKFQTIKLGYFQYFFNYFQYGIYQNFVFSFAPFGLFAQFFYFLQIMLLLGVANNILLSILANQVSKNSYLRSVQEMIDELQVKCPACGTDFQNQKSHAKNRVSKPQKQMFISKLVKDLQLQKLRSQSSLGSHKDSEYNIAIKSPNLSPFFPKKNQKKQDNQQFLSPKLQGKNVQNRLKEINKRVQNEQIYSQSKLQAYEQLKLRLKDNKKPKIQLSDSRIESELKSKYHQKLRNQAQLLFKKVQKFRQIKKQISHKTPLISALAQKETQVEVLNQILSKINNLQLQISLKDR